VLKITVLRRLALTDLVEEYMGDGVKEARLASPQCGLFYDGQEFILDSLTQAPEGFCVWAWSDLHKEILTLENGGTMEPWIKHPGTALACCTDALRPVIFELERIEA
jgi:uncharacterized repeat protein (TIGR04076 family)